MSKVDGEIAKRLLVLATVTPLCHDGFAHDLAGGSLPV
jgi:hypothetical protein